MEVLFCLRASLQLPAEPCMQCSACCPGAPQVPFESSVIVCGQRRGVLRRRVRLLRMPEHGGQRAAGGARAAGRAGARAAGVHAQGASPCAVASIQDVSARFKVLVTVRGTAAACEAARDLCALCVDGTSSRDGGTAWPGQGQKGVDASGIQRTTSSG